MFVISFYQEIHIVLSCFHIICGMIQSFESVDVTEYELLLLRLFRLSRLVWGVSLVFVASDISRSHLWTHMRRRWIHSLHQHWTSAYIASLTLNRIWLVDIRQVHTWLTDIRPVHIWLTDIGPVRILLHWHWTSAYMTHWRLDQCIYDV